MPARRDLAAERRGGGDTLRSVCGSAPNGQLLPCCACQAGRPRVARNRGSGWLVLRVSCAAGQAVAAGYPAAALAAAAADAFAAPLTSPTAAADTPAELLVGSAPVAEVAAAGGSS